MKQFTLGVLVGAFLWAGLTSGTADWEQANEENMFSIQYPREDLKLEPLRILFEPTTALDEDPVWTEKQRRSLQELMDDIQRRSDNHDIQLQHGLDERHDILMDFAGQVGNAFNVMWQAIRAILTAP